MVINRLIYSALILLCLYYDANITASESYFAQDFVRGIFSVAPEKPVLHHHASSNGDNKKSSESPSNIKKRRKINKLSLLVWNIHKGELIRNSKAPIPFSLKAYDIVALQENSWPWSLENLKYRGDHYFIPTFQMDGEKTGTSIISQIEPIIVKGAHTQYAEPFIITPKSYIHAKFKEFEFFNIHSLNFVTFSEYKYELERVLKETNEELPLILVGDFNTWDEERTTYLKKVMKDHRLKEVTFKKDLRSRFLGRPVDYIFARGFILRDAQVLPMPNHSDHNALEVVLQLMTKENSED